MNTNLRPEPIVNVILFITTFITYQLTMAAYHYQALTKNGKATKGVIEADSERQARQNLRDQFLIPTHLQILSVRVKKNRKKISSQELSLFTRQMATLLAAGIPVEETLLGVAEQTDKASIKNLIMSVRAKVLEGYSLAESLAEFPRAYPELYCSTIAAGEQTGKLDSVLEKLADYTEQLQASKQKVTQALIYPAVMILVSTGIISFLLAFVVPKIIEVFSNSGQSLPVMTELLINLSHFIQKYGVYIVIIACSCLMIFKQLLKKNNVKMAWHKIVLVLPISAYLIRSTNTARYIHTFAILFTAGVSVLETMRVSSSVLTNLVIKKQFEIAATRVKEGTSISIALKDTGFLTPMALHLIASGERSGQIAPMMERAANQLDNEVKQLVDTSLTLLEPAVILLMGAIVLFIVLATLLPIFSMEQLVG